MKNKMKTLNSLKLKDKHKKYFEHAKLLLEAIQEDQENWSSSVKISHKTKIPPKNKNNPKNNNF